MTSNTYAKAYRTEPRAPKNETFGFISYMDEPNTFSVVSVKRLVDLDKFGKGVIREKNKNYRITLERTGTLFEMEQLAKETEVLSAYTMNADVVSDTEEWHKRKRSVINTKEDETNILDKQLTDLEPFDFDGNRTYTTLTTCALDQLQPTVDRSQVSSDEDSDDNDEENYEEQQNTNKVANYQGLVPGLDRKLTSKRKKQRSALVSRGPSTKRLRTSDASSPTANQDISNFNQSTSSSSSVLKELNGNFIQIRKQVANVQQSIDQQHKTLNEILHNQKKMAKAMRQHQIPIVLSDETGPQASETTTSIGSVIYKCSTGEEIDLVQLPADRTRPNKFVLSAVDKIFNDEELLQLEADAMDQDSRILTIRNAVQTKFGLTKAEIETVWTSMLNSIKSRRRNRKSRNIRASIVSGNNLNNNSQSPLVQPLSSAEQNLNVQETHEQF